MNKTNTTIWHDTSGIDRLSANVKANDTRAKVAKVKAPTVQAIRAQAIANHLLHRVDTSQLGERDGVAFGACITTPSCVRGFGDSNCEYPSCTCHAMPIKATNYPAIQYAVEEPRPAGATRWIAAVLVAALAITFAVLSNPETTKAAIAFLGL